MDLKTGNFTVPKSGIYKFAFSSVKGANIILGNELRPVQKNKVAIEPAGRGKIASSLFLAKATKF